MRVRYWVRPFCIVILTQQIVLCLGANRVEAGTDAFLPHRIEKRDSSASPAIIQNDNQQYYQIAITTSRDKHAFYAAEFDSMFNNPGTVNVTQLLINGTWHESLTIQLKFLFYFYGHPVSRISVTENGHIFITEKGHEAGSFAQYIAPLMAGYNLLSNASEIAYVATNSSVWVRWTSLALAGVEGLFSFQCAIFKNGSMIFHYHNLPARADRVSGVKAGLADVYNYETAFGSGPAIRETLVHRVENISVASIVNNSVALITAMPNCGQLTSCGLCMTPGLAPTFSCGWCFQRGQCGSAVDVELQAWILQCHYAADSSCRLGDSGLNGAGQVARGVLAFFLALFLAMIVAFVVTLCVYGHRKPDSPVGQCLTKTSRQLREKLSGAAPRLPGVAYRSSNSQVRLQEEE